MNSNPSRCSSICGSLPSCDCRRAIAAAAAAQRFPDNYADRSKMLRAQMSARSAERVQKNGNLLAVASGATTRHFAQQVATGTLPTPNALFALRDRTGLDDYVCVSVGAIGSDGEAYALPLKVEYVPEVTSAVVARRMGEELAADLGLHNMPTIFIAPREISMGRVLQDRRLLATLASQNHKAPSKPIYIEAFRTSSRGGFEFDHAATLTLYGPGTPPFRRVIGRKSINAALTRVVRQYNEHPGDAYLKQSMHQRVTNDLDFSITVTAGYENHDRDKRHLRNNRSRLGIGYPPALGDSPIPPFAVQIACDSDPDEHLRLTQVDAIVRALDVTFGEGRFHVEQCLANYQETLSGIWAPGRLTDIDAVQAVTGLAVVQHLSTAPRRLRGR